MSKDSWKAPYLFETYEDVKRNSMEREFFNKSSPERQESQFKKPYLHDEHPQSERTLSPPGVGPRPPYPPPSPPGWDCSPSGNAVGGGTPDHCSPEVECGVWDFTCCHKITNFSALGGVIQSVVKGYNDTCRVTACWNEEDGKLSVIGTIGDTGQIITGTLDKGACLGEGHDPDCTNCATCENSYPAIGYTSLQMNVNGTQALTASGGGGGPYVWRIVSGGGSLSGSVGFSVIYTAPASNANCVNNPTIEVMDVCNRTNTISFAVSGTADGPATVHFFYVDTAHWAEWCSCTSACESGCSCCGPAPLADCEAAGYCGAPPVTGCGPCNDPGGGHDCTPRFQDIRTSALLAAGCCPANLL